MAGEGPDRAGRRSVVARVLRRPHRRGASHQDGSAGPSRLTSRSRSERARHSAPRRPTGAARHLAPRPGPRHRRSHTSSRASIRSSTILLAAAVVAAVVVLATGSVPLARGKVADAVIRRSSSMSAPPGFSHRIFEDAFVGRKLGTQALEHLHHEQGGRRHAMERRRPWGQREQPRRVQQRLLRAHPGLGRQRPDAERRQGLDPGGVRVDVGGGLDLPEVPVRRGICPDQGEGSRRGRHVAGAVDAARSRRHRGQQLRARHFQRAIASGTP